MNSSMLSKENSDTKLLENFIKLSKNSKNSNNELKKVKQEKESLIIKLSESHALIDYLKYENTMLFNTIDTLENKLKESEDIMKKFSSDNLKIMLCIYTDISNKPNLIIDDLNASTSHVSDHELDSIVIKPMIVYTACLDNSENSCLIGDEKPKSDESGTPGKFVPTYGKIGHIRPNCYLLKSHRPWNKQVDPKKGKIENPSSDKYVTPHFFYFRDIYLKKVRTLFCVIMLTLKLQSLSRSISANKDSLPAITAVSQDTSGHTVIRSGIRSLESRSKSQR
jgi:hypothetical protein